MAPSPAPPMNESHDDDNNESTGGSDSENNIDGGSNVPHDAPFRQTRPASTSALASPSDDSTFEEIDASSVDAEPPVHHRRCGTGFAYPAVPPPSTTPEQQMGLGYYASDKNCPPNSAPTAILTAPPSLPPGADGTRGMLGENPPVLTSKTSEEDAESGSSRIGGQLPSRARIDDKSCHNTTSSGSHSFDAVDWDVTGTNNFPTLAAARQNLSPEILRVDTCSPTATVATAAENTAITVAAADTACTSKSSAVHSTNGDKAPALGSEPAPNAQSGRTGAIGTARPTTGGGNNDWPSCQRSGRIELNKCGPSLCDTRTEPLANTGASASIGSTEGAATFSFFPIELVDDFGEMSSDVLPIDLISEISDFGDLDLDLDINLLWTAMDDVKYDTVADKSDRSQPYVTGAFVGEPGQGEDAKPPAKSKTDSHDLLTGSVRDFRQHNPSALKEAELLSSIPSTNLPHATAAELFERYRSDYYGGGALSRHAYQERLAAEVAMDHVMFASVSTVAKAAAAAPPFSTRQSAMESTEGTAVSAFPANEKCSEAPGARTARAFTRAGENNASTAVQPFSKHARAMDSDTGSAGLAGSSAGEEGMAASQADDDGMNLEAPAWATPTRHRMQERDKEEAPNSVVTPSPKSSRHAKLPAGTAKKSKRGDAAAPSSAARAIDFGPAPSVPRRLFQGPGHDGSSVKSQRPTALQISEQDSSVHKPAPPRLDRASPASVPPSTQNTAKKTGPSEQSTRVMGPETSRKKKRDGAWKKHFKELLNFVKKHGHPHVPSSFPKNQKLSTWVRRQRYLYAFFRSDMPTEHIDALESVGFRWSTHEKSWDDKYNELSLYYELEGQGACVGKSNPQLSKWMKQQRRHYRDYLSGKSTSLTATRINRLNAIGFPWNPKAKKSIQTTRLHEAGKAVDSAQNDRFKTQTHTAGANAGLARRTHNQGTVLDVFGGNTTTGLPWDVARELSYVGTFAPMPSRATSPSGAIAVTTTAAADAAAQSSASLYANNTNPAPRDGWSDLCDNYANVDTVMADVEFPSASSVLAELSVFPRTAAISHTPAAAEHTDMMLPRGAPQAMDETQPRTEDWGFPGC